MPAVFEACSPSFPVPMIRISPRPVWSCACILLPSVSGGHDPHCPFFFFLRLSALPSNLTFLLGVQRFSRSCLRRVCACRVTFNYLCICPYLGIGVVYGTIFKGVFSPDRNAHSLIWQEINGKEISHIFPDHIIYEDCSSRDIFNDCHLHHADSHQKIAFSRGIWLGVQPDS